MVGEFDANADGEVTEQELAFAIARVSASLHETEKWLMDHPIYIVVIFAFLLLLACGSFLLKQNMDQAKAFSPQGTLYLEIFRVTNVKIGDGFQHVRCRAEFQKESKDTEDLARNEASDYAFKKEMIFDDIDLNVQGKNTIVLTVFCDDPQNMLGQCWVDIKENFGSPAAAGHYQVQSFTPFDKIQGTVAKIMVRGKFVPRPKKQQ